MTKDVLISISGLQFIDGENQGPVEVISGGAYYYRNGKHYIIYDEVLEGYEGTIQNKIKIGPQVLEVTKKGLSSIHMVFEKNKKNMTYYDTPIGTMLVGIAATDISVRETEENIDVKIEYALEINYEHIADCTIQMNIKSKQAKDFSLSS